MLRVKAPLLGYRIFREEEGLLVPVILPLKDAWGQKGEWADAHCLCNHAPTCPHRKEKIFSPYTMSKNYPLAIHHWENPCEEGPGVPSNPCEPLCGFYAMRNIKVCTFFLMREWLLFSHSKPILAQVELAGFVAVHTEGYRATKARIVQIMKRLSLEEIIGIREGSVLLQDLLVEE